MNVKCKGNSKTGEAIFIGEDKAHDVGVKSRIWIFREEWPYLILEEDGRGYQDEKLK